MPDVIYVGDDPVVIPSTETTVDENGNTVVTGYPSGGSSTYDGPVSTSPSDGTGIILPGGPDGE
ncbi:hypothetical protein [Streptomyces lydicus]|uniref:hypothetical protein n=1 Tax=Streptomyces lydicus TaxID=47763 RepID=UPI0036E15D80